MLIEGDPEILRLRAVLRDLVALSSIPATSIGREPPEVAAGFADALHGLLQVDFAFVRLCDPGGAGAVDAMRGSDWPTFPHWLQGHLAARGRLTGKEVVTDVDGEERCRGVLIPVGINGEGGVVAAGCRRSDFPSKFDQLLLSLAANYAASAFQNARLIHERRKAEAELRQARDELEVKVIERTAELRRSEGYLAEAQRVAQIGSFALSVPQGDLTHSSDEHSGLFGFDPELGVPSWEEFLERIHPEDRGLCTQALRRGIRETASFEMEYRIALPETPLKYIRALAHPALAPSGEVAEFVGTAMDVTERQRAEEERQTRGARLACLAQEQAALRRVATLVARRTPPEEVFAAVIEEVGQLLALGLAFMGRYEPGGAVTVLASWGDADDIVAVGSRWVLGGKNVCTAVSETGRAARIDQYADASGQVGAAGGQTGFRSAVGAPVIVEGDLWGVIAAGSTSEVPLPGDTEARLASFTELVATAIADAESRAGLARLAEEQAALRRVATLVASGVPPEEVFAAVTEEIGQLLSVDLASMCRYEPDRSVTMVATWGRAGESAPVGTSWPLGGQNLATIVFETGSPGRIEPYADAAGPLGLEAGATGLGSAVATPIVVNGRVWGVIGAGTTVEQPLPADTEARLASFTELVATAIANAEARTELAASRARIVAAADDARRRIERDLHDRAQQRIVSLMLQLRAAEAAQPATAGELNAQLGRGLAEVLDELREISRGIHPAVLSSGGLEPALRALARRSAVPVELDLHAEQRLPEQVEVAAYYVVSEALTNAAKHSRASVVHVELKARDENVRLAIRDDGIGGAHARQGSGLVGLGDRIESLSGTLEVTSPAGGGTILLIELPVKTRGEPHIR
jgi:signal transduction histidine kinase/PAS domain-containing protein